MNNFCLPSHLRTWRTIYAQRSQAIREIEAECLRGEQGEKVDLDQIAEKLSALVEQFNEEARVTNEGRKANSAARNGYDLQTKELSVLNERVKALSNKADSIPSWIKPVAYTALAVAGIAAMAFIGSNILSSRTPAPTPTPVPTPTPTPSPTPSPSDFLLFETAKSGDAQTMNLLERSWKEGSISSTEPEQSSIRREFRSAIRKKDNKQGAMNGYLPAMNFLERTWQTESFSKRNGLSGSVTEEEEKSAIRKAYKLASKK